MNTERKLGINTDCLQGRMDDLSTLELAHEIGFQTITTSLTQRDAVAELKEKADRLGVEFPFLHAPFRGINSMWLEGEDYRKVYDGMKEAVDSAAACGVGGVVVHVSSGWKAPMVNDLGISRYDSLVEYAAERGVTVLLENLRMVGNLTCLMDRYENMRNVRYCYDCGHEHCYTKTVCWPDIFTTKIVATHIHDNPGRPFDDKVSDYDMHWLPFDGTFNYHHMMQKLNQYGYEGPLVLEVYRTAREDYKSMTAQAFLETCYERICRIAHL